MGAMIILIVFLLCVFTSVPIGFSIGLSVVAYALATGSVNMGYIASGLFASCDSFPLMAIPFFILSGALMEGGGLSKRLVLFFDSLVGHLTGGLAIVTVITCMFFGAISGSGPATTAAVGAIMVHTMVEKGYDKKTGKMLVCVNPKWYRPTDVVNLWGDPTKAKTKLGWNPQKTSYEQLCAIMAEHDLQLAKKEAESK